VTVTWGESAEQRIAGVATDSELDSLLDVLEADASARPILVNIEDGARVLTVGLGAPWAVLCLCSAAGDPPYLISRGPGEQLGAEAPLWFDFMGSESEFRAANAMAKVDARQAVRDFLASGTTPGVEWVET
jgi:hypothetical protein